MVTATISTGGTYPVGVAVTPDSTKVYVANNNSSNVSVIDTATSTVTATITLPCVVCQAVGSGTYGVAVTPDGGKVYVAG